MLLADLVLGGVDLLIEAEGVLKAAAPAAGDADPQDGGFGQFLLGQHPLDFAGGFFSQGNGHESSSFAVSSGQDEPGKPRMSEVYRPATQCQGGNRRSALAVQPPLHVPTGS